jgi:hypothetical protein
MQCFYETVTKVQRIVLNKYLCWMLLLLHPSIKGLTIWVLKIKTDFGDQSLYPSEMGRLFFFKTQILGRLTPQSKVFLKNLIVVNLVKKLPYRSQISDRTTVVLRILTFSSVLLGRCKHSTSIRPQPLHSKSFPILFNNHSIFNAM